MNVLKLMKIINTKLPPYIWAWIAKYKNYEEQTGSGTLVFENTYGQKFSNFEVFGNTTQDGTPAPETPVPINNVTGDNEIKVENKNFLINSFITQTTTNGITATPRIDGGITLNGTATSNVFIILSNTQNFGEIDFTSAVNNSDKFKAILINEIIGVRLQYTHGNTATSVRIGNGTTVNNLTVYPMIVAKNETNLSFVKHEEQTVTFPLSEGQYMAKGDYLADNGIHHVMGKIQINTTNFNINSGGYTNLFYLTNKTITNFYGGFIGNCSNFKLVANEGITGAPQANSLLSNNEIGFRQGSTQDRFYLKSTNFTETTDLATFLDNNIVILEYVLKEETIEPYTQAQQEAWNAIKELHTYLDYTQITQTNDGLSFILKVSVN